jgi:membrane-associated phospholipid phosphatase
MPVNLGDLPNLINLENDMQRLYKKTVIATAITAIIYFILYFFFDKDIDLWIHHNCSNTWLFNSGTFISLFAKSAPIKLGIALCFISMIISDPSMKRRSTKYVLYICTSVSIAIIIGDGLKYLLGRYRPIMLFEKNLYGLHLFSSEWSLNSTPSGHTLRAFAILTALSLLYRRFTLVFISFAAVIGASRVIVTDHYTSDVVFGAFIGIITASWTYKYFFIQDRLPAHRS